MSLTVNQLLKNDNIIKEIKNILNKGNGKLYIIDDFKSSKNRNEIIDIIRKKEKNGEIVNKYFLDNEIINIIISNEKYELKMKKLIKYYNEVINKLKKIIILNKDKFKKLYRKDKDIKTENLINDILYNLKLINRDGTLKKGNYLSELKLIFINEDNKFENLLSLLDIYIKKENLTNKEIKDLFKYFNKIKFLKINETSLNQQLSNIKKYQNISTDLQEYIQTLILSELINYGTKEYKLNNNEFDIKKIINNISNIIEKNDKYIIFFNDKTLKNLYIKEIKENINIYKNWIISGINHYKSISSILEKNLEPYYFYRQSNFLKPKLRKHILDLVKKEKKYNQYNLNINKWNPADIYFFPSKYQKLIEKTIKNLLFTKNINELNKRFNSLIENYELYPYSLKLLKKKHFFLKFYNFYKKSKNINLKLELIGDFNNIKKSTYIFIDEKNKLNLRSFQKENYSISIEIEKENSNSRHGKISGNNSLRIIDNYIKEENTLLLNFDKFEKLLKNFNNSNKEDIKNYTYEILIDIIKIAKEKNIDIGKLNKYKNLKINSLNNLLKILIDKISENDEILINKFQSFYIIYLILNNNNINKILTNIYNYANGESDFSTKFLKTEDHLTQEELISKLKKMKNFIDKNKNKNNYIYRKIKKYLQNNSFFIQNNKVLEIKT